MSNFEYTAIDAKNAFSSGVLKARSKKRVFKSLERDGLQVINVKSQPSN